jgi:hypothetical protein
MISPDARLQAEGQPRLARHLRAALEGIHQHLPLGLPVEGGVHLHAELEPVIERLLVRLITDEPQGGGVGIDLDGGAAKELRQLHRHVKLRKGLGPLRIVETDEFGDHGAKVHHLQAPLVAQGLEGVALFIHLAQVVAGGGPSSST